MQAAPQLYHASRGGEVTSVMHAAILHGLFDAVLVVDIAGETVLANRALSDLGEPDLEVLRQSAARGERFNGEIEVAAAHGQRLFDARTLPVRTRDGVLHGGVIVLTERTDRRQLRLHEEFMAIASHELRSPLTAMSGSFEMLSRRVGDDLDERSTQHLVRAKAQIHRLVGLVNELTDLARLHSDKLALNLERVDLLPLLEQIVEAVRALSAAHTVTLQAPGGPVMVMADAQRLDQVLMNLVGNAVKYAPDCERIDVRLEIVDSEALINVEDYGPGIEDGDRQSIFMPYFQARRNGRVAETGLGLGLYIAREIMLAHGGDLELATSSHQGCVFCARLPLAR